VLMNGGKILNSSFRLILLQNESRCGKKVLTIFRAVSRISPTSDNVKIAFEYKETVTPWIQ